jgi:hypothetical protein
MKNDYTCKHFKTVLQNKSTGAVIAVIIRIVFLFHIPMSYETNEEKNGMGTKMLITIYIPNSFIVNIPTAAPLAISYLVSFPVDALHMIS